MILPNGDIPSYEEKELWTDKYTENMINQAIMRVEDGGLKI